MLAFATMASAAQAGPDGGIGRDLAVSAVEKISARHCMRGRAGRGCERADGRRGAASPKAHSAVTAPIGALPRRNLATMFAQNIGRRACALAVVISASIIAVKEPAGPSRTGT